MIGASLSEPHTSVTSLCLYVYMFALLGPTTYLKSLPALNLLVLHHAVIQKGLKDSYVAINCEQTTSSMATTTTCGLTYSVSRAIEVTAWQSVDSVFLCCLTHGSCHWTQISSGYTAMGATGSACPLICPCHLHMTATCAGPACVPHALGLTHSSCVVHVCMFCVIFCGFRFSDILVTVLCMQLVYVLHVHSLRLTLQCHAFI